jgi:hypothetical protein
MFTRKAEIGRTNSMLWTRKGYLIPILWILGVIAVYFFDRYFPNIIPSSRVVTVGHILGAFLVLIFSFRGGSTTYEKVENDDEEADEEEEIVLKRPHRFFFLTAKTWALLLMIISVWMLYLQPKREIIDQAVVSQKIIIDKIKESSVEVSARAKEILTGEPTMRDWKNKEGKVIRAKLIGLVITPEGEFVRFTKEGGKEFRYNVEDLSTEDQNYINAKKGESEKNNR